MGRLDGPQFVRTRKIHVADGSVPVSSEFGFTSVRGTVWYIPGTRSLSVFVSGVKHRNNLGPGFSQSTNIGWPVGGTNQKGMRDHLFAVLKETAQKVQLRELPKRDVQLAKCNTAGMDVEQFMDTVCSGCVCQYCELSGV